MTAPTDRESAGQGPADGGPAAAVLARSVLFSGWDAEKKLHYFVADTSIDHRPGGLAQNKSNTGLIHMTQTSNADNQTYDVKVIRNQYAHGDSYSGSHALYQDVPIPAAAGDSYYGTGVYKSVDSGRTW